jgi:hypothetical protein
MDRGHRAPNVDVLRRHGAATFGRHQRRRSHPLALEHLPQSLKAMLLVSSRLDRS